MSTSEGKRVDEDITAGRNVTVVKDATICGCATVGHDLRVGGWLDAPNIRSVHKGLFMDADELRRAHPNPQPGAWAVVGSVANATIYRVINGHWADSGEAVNLGSFAADSNLNANVEDMQSAYGALAHVVENTQLINVNELTYNSGNPFGSLRQALDALATYQAQQEQSVNIGPGTVITFSLKAGDAPERWVWYQLMQNYYSEYYTDWRNSNNWREITPHGASIGRFFMFDNAAWTDGSVELEVDSVSEPGDLTVVENDDMTYDVFKTSFGGAYDWVSLPATDAEIAKKGIATEGWEYDPRIIHKNGKWQLVPDTLFCASRRTDYIDVNNARTIEYGKFFKTNAAGELFGHESWGLGEELAWLRSQVLPKLKSIPDDAILDLGVVESSTEAFSAAAAAEVVSNPRIRIIVWRTSDNKDDGGFGAGGTIFQERYGNWHVTQWMMFEGPKKICKVRNITTGGNYNCGAWQNVVLPTKFAFDSSNGTIKWGGIADDSADRAVVSIPLAAANVSKGLMSKTDKQKLDKIPDGAIVHIGDFSSKNAACNYAARSEIAGDTKIALILFTATGATGAKLQGRIFQMVNGEHVSMQYLMWDKRLWRRNITGATGVAGANTSAFDWAQCGVQSLAYDDATRKLSANSYERDELTSVTLPEATTSHSGLMTATAKQKLDSLPKAEDALIMAKREAFADLWRAWDGTLTDTGRFVKFDVEMDYDKAVRIYGMHELIDRVAVAGVKFNAATELFSLNGIDDLTRQDVELIDLEWSLRQGGAPVSRLAESRTNYYTSQSSSSQGFYNFQVLNMEVLRLPVVSYPTAFGGWLSSRHTKLRRIIGEMDMTYFKNPSQVGDGLNCPNLTDVKFSHLKVNFSIAKLASISLESLTYLVGKSTNGSNAITVTVHGNIYSKLTEEANAEWHALLEAAAARNISFATIGS